MEHVWPTTEEQVSTFSSMLDEARREQEEETDKRKRMRLCSRFGNPDEWTDRQRDFFQRHPQLLERHRELTISFRVHHDPGPGPADQGLPDHVAHQLMMMPPELSDEDSDAEEFFEILNDQEQLDMAGGAHLWLDM